MSRESISAWQQANVRPADAFELLHAAGYELFRMDDRAHPEPRPLVSGSPLPAYLDLMAIHPATGPRIVRRGA